MGKHVESVSDRSFQNDVLESKTPVLVDFWAEWCGPCKMIGPILEEVAPTVADQIKITKMNVDDNIATPSKYGIRGIPTLIIFKDGEVAGTHVGALGKSQLEAFIKKHV